MRSAHNTSPRKAVRPAEGLARRRVPLGFLFGILVIWLARPTRSSLLAGGIVALVGEMFRVWAAGHLEKGREVTQSGPYRVVRHPLYLGTAIVGAGVAVASANGAAALLVAIYLGSTLTAAIQTEEAAMRTAFGDQYEDYLRSRARPLARGFSLDRALRNKEHRAIVGLAIGAALFAAKAIFVSP